MRKGWAGDGAVAGVDEAAARVLAPPLVRVELVAQPAHALVAACGYRVSQNRCPISCCDISDISL